eukprot:1083484-Amphidinium_carterae.1
MSLLLRQTLFVQAFCLAQVIASVSRKPGLDAGLAQVIASKLLLPAEHHWISQQIVVHLTITLWPSGATTVALKVTD